MKIDYDSISGSYHQRYKKSELKGIRKFLSNLQLDKACTSILDAGTGTGFCLEQLFSEGRFLFGLDISSGMLREAQKRNRGYNLLQADLHKMPFKEGSFDLVISMNVIHQCENPEQVIHSTKNLLRAGGSLKIISADPRYSEDEWYIYEYFDTTKDKDLLRYPRIRDIISWMEQSDYKNISSLIIDRVDKSFKGESVFSDPFLHKSQSSQLASLTPELYGEGINRIRREVETASGEANSPVFRTRITFHLIEGFVG